VVNAVQTIAPSDTEPGTIAAVCGQHSNVTVPSDTLPSPWILNVTNRGSGRTSVWPLPVVGDTCNAVVTFSIMTLSSILHLQGQMDYTETVVAALRALVFRRRAAAADACGFDVLFTPQEGRPNRERLIQFADTTIIVGPLFVTLTNLSTGKTINLNISGPGQFHFTTNTFVGEGPSIPGPLPADVATAAGVPLLPLFHGRVVYTFDAEGNLISISFTGPVQDVCQLLE
jgi:hypothetical protein